MNAVLLAPHHDDETIFAAFLAQKHQPDLIVCTRADVQERRGSDVTAEQRDRETRAAWEILCPGRTVTFWPFTDDPVLTPWNDITAAILRLDDLYDVCIAPAWESGGHEHHNHVATYARGTFGDDRTIRYCTYRRGYGRTTGNVVEIEQAVWIARKLSALACYESQITEPTTRTWFLDGLIEYVA